MSFIKEFKEFALRGNVLDLAVGVVIGAAFGKITTSLVDQIIMPPIGLLLGGVDFSQWKWVLRAADPAQKISEVAIQFGAFINTIIQFAIIALAVFVLIKIVNRVVRKEKVEEAAPAPAADVVLLAKIRDLLKNK